MPAGRQQQHREREHVSADNRATVDVRYVPSPIVITQRVTDRGSTHPA